MQLIKCLKPILASAVLATAVSVPMVSAEDLPETNINYVGTWGFLSLYKKVEQPFWGGALKEASGGSVKVNAQPFTEMGLKGNEI